MVSMYLTILAILIVLINRDYWALALLIAVADTSWEFLKFMGSGGN